MINAVLLITVSGYLIEAHGDVSLHRHEASRATPVSAGSEVRAGDTIRPKNGAKARILCPDLLTTWEPAPASESGVFEGCPRQVEHTRIRGGQSALGIRTGERLPWVLTPSNTALTTAHPMIRWEPVPGITRYRVSILELARPPRLTWGPALVEGTNIQYTGSRPLVAGSQYFVRVEANGAFAEGKPFVIATAALQNETQERLRAFRAHDRGRTRPRDRHQHLLAQPESTCGCPSGARANHGNRSESGAETSARSLSRRSGRRWISAGCAAERVERRGTNPRRVYGSPDSAGISNVVAETGGCRADHTTRPRSPERPWHSRVAGRKLTCVFGAYSVCS